MKKLSGITKIGMIVLIIIGGSLYIYQVTNPLHLPYNFKFYNEQNYNCKNFSYDLSKQIEDEYDVWIVTGYCSDLITKNLHHAWIEVNGISYDAVYTRKLDSSLCIVESKLRSEDFKNKYMVTL